MSVLLAIPEKEITPAVQNAIGRLLAQVRDIRAQLQTARAHLERLEQMVDQDSLMPIANRRAFVRELNRAIALNRREGTPFGLLYCDINGLKRINDEFGHAAGDAVLNHVVSLLSANIRASDLLARLGGDEFAIILPQVDSGTATEKAAQLRRKVEASACPWQGKMLPVSLAIGTAIYDGTESADQTLAEADKAMYREKMSSPHH